LSRILFLYLQRITADDGTILLVRVNGQALVHSQYSARVELVHRLDVYNISDFVRVLSVVTRHRGCVPYLYKYAMFSGSALNYRCSCVNLIYFLLRASFVCDEIK